MSKRDVMIWAGIVVYHPDLGKLGKLIGALEKQVDKIMVYNNGGCLDSCISNLFQAGAFEVIGCGDNVGIGEALNEICRSALSNNVDYIVTFDQDSFPGPDFVQQLYQSFESLRNANKRVAAVGPVFVDERGAREVSPVFQAGRFWVKKINPISTYNAAISASILITSGMLFDISAWEKIGQFREDYFIDHVDTEWCLRALQYGFSLFVCPLVIMPHELSDEAPKRIFGRLVLKYSHIRRYYAFRNTISLIKMRHIPQGMRNYLFVTIIYRFFINLFVDENKIKSLYSMLTGMLHGLAGRMGKL